MALFREKIVAPKIIDRKFWSYNSGGNELMLKVLIFSRKNIKNCKKKKKKKKFQVENSLMKKILDPKFWKETLG